MALVLRVAAFAGLLRMAVCELHVGMGMGDTFMYEYNSYLSTTLHVVSSADRLARGESSSPTLADPAFGFYTSVPRRGGRGGYLGLSSRGGAPMHIVSDDEDVFQDRARLELASAAPAQTDCGGARVSQQKVPQLVIERVR